MWRVFQRRDGRLYGRCADPRPHPDRFGAGRRHSCDRRSGACGRIHQRSGFVQRLPRAARRAHRPGRRIYRLRHRTQPFGQCCAELRHQRRVRLPDRAGCRERQCDDRHLRSQQRQRAGDRRATRPARRHRFVPASRRHQHGRHAVHRRAIRRHRNRRRFVLYARRRDAERHHHQRWHWQRVGQRNAGAQWRHGEFPNAESAGRRQHDRERQPGAGQRRQCRRRQWQLQRQPDRRRQHRVCRIARTRGDRQHLYRRAGKRPKLRAEHRHLHAQRRQHRRRRGNHRAGGQRDDDPVRRQQHRLQQRAGFGYAQRRLQPGPGVAGARCGGTGHRQLQPAERHARGNDRDSGRQRVRHLHADRRQQHDGQPDPGAEYRRHRQVQPAGWQPDCQQRDGEYRRTAHLRRRQPEHQRAEYRPRQRNGHRRRDDHLPDPQRSGRHQPDRRQQHGQQRQADRGRQRQAGNVLPTERRRAVGTERNRGGRQQPHHADRRQQQRLGAHRGGQWRRRGRLPTVRRDADGRQRQRRQQRQLHTRHRPGDGFRHADDRRHGSVERQRGARRGRPDPCQLCRQPDGRQQHHDWRGTRTRGDRQHLYRRAGRHPLLHAEHRHLHAQRRQRRSRRGSDRTGRHRYVHPDRRQQYGEPVRRAGNHPEQWRHHAGWHADPGLGGNRHRRLCAERRHAEHGGRGGGRQRVGQLHADRRQQHHGNTDPGAERRRHRRLRPAGWHADGQPERGGERRRQLRARTAARW